MSKTVTIPTWSNPFTVSINDKDYTYPAGATVEVPDEVAAAIEAATRKKEPAPTQPPFSGGVSSWNDLTDKPFGDLPTGGDTLTWDGNTEGLVSAKDVLFKVCDAVLTDEDLANGLTITASDGAAIPVEGAILFEDGVVAILGSVVFVQDGVDGLEAGVYLFYEDGFYVSSLTIPGYTGFPAIKKLDKKFMEALTVFYQNGDGYIYADNQCSTKATKAEFEEAVNGGFVLLRYNYATGTLDNVPITTSFANSYGYAVCMTGYDSANKTATFAEFYTAEYTAS